MNYRVGDTVFYYSVGTLREVLVDEKESDIKNGRPGFGGIVLSGPDKGMSVWGYDETIVQVSHA